MEITERIGEFTKKEIYKMTKDASIIQMKNVPDETEIEVAKYLTFEDEKDDGEKTTIHSILSTDGTAYAYQSRTFDKSLMDIADIMNDRTFNEPFTIKKISGKTKAGRDFINCALV